MILRARFKPAEPVPGDVVSAEARMLAMAYLVEQAVESGRLQSCAEAARALGVTRARMSQVMQRRWANVHQQEHALRETKETDDDECQTN